MLELAARLAKRRYALWWDARLLPRDVFGDSILARIDAAKAVVAVWPVAAAGLEWVHFDAGRAHSQNKLVSVRTAGNGHVPIPPPFHAFATFLSTELDRIEAALTELGVPRAEGAAALNDGRECNEAALVWDQIKDSDNAKVFDLFHQHYGEHYILYRRLAQKKIADLRANGAPPLAPPAPPPTAADLSIRIEAGMHTGIVNRAGVDAAARLLITGSDDKTARLWALGGEGGAGAGQPKPPRDQPGDPMVPQPAAGTGTGTGIRLLRILRVPAGEANDGQIYAVALSPGGEFAAAGGYTRKLDHWVYIFEAATGRLVTRLGKLGNVVLHLAFSHDGRRLAAALGGGEGVRVWETRTWRLAGEDRDYGGESSHAVAFDQDGWLYSVAGDGFLRCYSLVRPARPPAAASPGPTLTLEGRTKTRGGREPISVAVHPAGGQISVGFHDSPAVEIYEAPGLGFLFAANTTGVDNGNMGSAAWLGSRNTLDDMQLVAGGHYCDNGKFSLRFWSRGGRGAYRDLPLADGTIMHLLSAGDNLAVAAQDPAFGLIGAGRERILWRGPVTADMRGKRGQHFTVSQDGCQVRFGLGFAGASPVLFDAAAVQLVDAPEPLASLAPPDTATLKITSWQNEPVPAVDGRPLALDRDEICRSLAVAGNGSSFILGTDLALRAFGREGKPLWRRFAPGPAWGVNVSGDGKILVAAYGDGSVRWHRVADGEELLALFVLPAGRRWVAWTPRGYYAASAGGADLIGWHVNRGYEEAPDFFPAGLFRDFFYKPDAVAAAVAGPAAKTPPSAKRSWLR